MSDRRVRYFRCYRRCTVGASLLLICCTKENRTKYIEENVLTFRVCGKVNVCGTAPNFIVRFWKRCNRPQTVSHMSFTSIQTQINLFLYCPIDKLTVVIAAIESHSIYFIFSICPISIVHSPCACVCMRMQLQPGISFLRTIKVQTISTFLVEKEKSRTHRDSFTPNATPLWCL